MLFLEKRPELWEFLSLEIKIILFGFILVIFLNPIMDAYLRRRRVQ